MLFPPAIAAFPMTDPIEKWPDWAHDLKIKSQIDEMFGDLKPRTWWVLLHARDVISFCSDSWFMLYYRGEEPITAVKH